jgi:hypothetical protein
MWHKSRAQSSVSGAGRPHLLGRPARCWRLFKLHFANVSRKVGARGIQCPKLVQPGNMAARCDTPSVTVAATVPER